MAACALDEALIQRPTRRAIHPVRYHLRGSPNAEATPLLSSSLIALHKKAPMILDAIRWMDASIVNPVATRLAGSVANPAVLSFLLWERLKTLTPQHARDLMRLLSTAVANALGVLRAERGKQLGVSFKQLQKDFLRAASSRSGREVVLNTVATMAKVAQALNTPETKAATQQLFQTLQSVVDFFASYDGRRIISSTGQCLTSVTEVTASPEASIFLAELATNILHTLESEAKRQHSSSAKEKEEVKEKKEEEQDGREWEVDQELPRETEADHERDHNDSYSPASSMAETRRSFDTESMLSSAPGTPTMGMFAPHAPAHGPMSSSSPMLPRSRHQALISPLAEKSKSYRSARIEKEVLLKLGVDPSLLSEIQRVLDVVTADEEEKELAELQRRREEAEIFSSLVVPESADAGITHAFGNDEDEEKTDDVTHGNEGVSDPTSELLPEWHEEPLREALRHRHAHAEASMKERDSAHRQVRKMAAVLARRNIEHGDLQPGDIVACRIIARMIVYGAGLSLLLSGYLLSRKLFG
ncbi:hypothetical protein KXD40_002791 [Peronospora effusa]|nr:hypothetical protein KXD40_002791 [Peronospora effusa]CAI5701565.1 unnamed protein product [Peronospora effusa]